MYVISHMDFYGNVVCFSCFQLETELSYLHCTHVDSRQVSHIYLISHGIHGRMTYKKLPPSSAYFKGILPMGGADRSLLHTGEHARSLLQGNTLHLFSLTHHSHFAFSASTSGPSPGQNGVILSNKRLQPRPNPIKAMHALPPMEDATHRRRAILCLLESCVGPNTQKS